MNGILVKKIKTGERIVLGISVDIPGTEKKVLQIKCKTGMLFCALFSTDRINIIDFAACIISPAPEFKDMLENKPVFISEKAKDMGVTINMTGKEIIEIFER